MFGEECRDSLLEESFGTQSACGFSYITIRRSAVRETKVVI